MVNHISPGARVRRRIAVYAFALAGSFARVAGAQAHEDDHGHDHLHFSHPLLTESPSPDSKLRLDVAFASDRLTGSHAMALKAEGEFAFSRSFSIAVTAPFVRITSPGPLRTSAFGSVEVSAKAASFAFAESGILLGGGMSLGLPTGSDAKGIGSGHLYEIAPFLDAAIRRGNLETVGFLTYSTTANRDPGEASENALTLDGSVLWRFLPQVELLAEMTTSRAVGGSPGARSETFVAPGIKWRPVKFPKLAFGVAGIFGVGGATKSNALQTTAFYHF